MPRFIAFHTLPGITEEHFNEALGDASKWRPNPRTTILKVYCNLAEGKLVSECEAVEQAQFEEWIANTGWPVDSIHQVDLVQQVGNIWKL